MLEWRYSMLKAKGEYPLSSSFTLRVQVLVFWLLDLEEFGAAFGGLDTAWSHVCSRRPKPVQ
jgi:hypothetical protein